MIGKIIIDILFVASLISTVLYFLAVKNDKGLYIKIARSSFYIVFLGIIFISGYFMYLIMTHDFQYTYIWSYTSTQLSKYLLASSFYAGQEGSFLLWALFVAILGMFLLPYVKKNNYEAVTMGFYSLILAFILLLMILKSPFQYIWQSFPDVAEGFLPKDGRGMNPILENFWMTIHPPILFLGYAAMSVPYIFSVSGLIKKDYHNWIRISLPWTLAASGFLGLGIGLGGYWAYETLGWGGFWGWDPVENSSLLPWLISMALIHTMLIQRKTGGLEKTNYLLAILSFIFVLYATFLTRSGVLGDTSVHSFVDPGSLVYAFLLIFILVFLFLGIILLIIRVKDLNKNKMNFALSSKETFVTTGAIMLLISTIIVFIGTSFPIFLELTGQTKTSVEITFYDKWNLPVAVVFMLLCGFSFYTTWRASKFSSNLKGVVLPLLVSILGTAVLYFAGVSEVKHLFLAMPSIFCMYIAILNLLRVIRKKPASIGAFVSHAGLGIFFLGVIFSGGYTLTTSLQLAKGETQSALGYNFTFLGSDRVEKEKHDREKYKCNVKIEKDGDFFLASPIVYWSEFNQKQQPFFEPGIEGYLTRDLYISPKALNYENDMPSVILTKGESAQIPFDSSTTIKLNEFDMSHGTDMNSGDGKFKFGVVIQYETVKDTIADTLYIGLDMANGSSTPYWKELKNANISIGFSNFRVEPNDMSKSTAEFSFFVEGMKSKEPREVFTFEVSVKPFMMFVWIGSFAVVFGFFIAIFKYRKKKD
ncbi:MAG: cytochrome c-type biogenesis CcmF C-terminal domain-containing protein [bacterium]